MLVGNVFGSAGASVVVEEYMAGEEASFFAVTDGDFSVPLVSAQVRFAGTRLPDSKVAHLTRFCWPLDMYCA